MNVNEQEGFHVEANAAHGNDGDGDPNALDNQVDLAVQADNPPVDLQQPDDDILEDPDDVTLDRLCLLYTSPSPRDS